MTSLLEPQELAMRLLPRKLYEMLYEFATIGCKAECGPPWKDDVIAAARAAGPHVSAMLDDSVELIWEDVEYQKAAGFVDIIKESDLFKGKLHPNLKVSRVAIISRASGFVGLSRRAWVFDSAAAA